MAFAFHYKTNGDFLKVKFGILLHIFVWFSHKKLQIILLGIYNIYSNMCPISMEKLDVPPGHGWPPDITMSLSALFLNFSIYSFITLILLVIEVQNVKADHRKSQTEHLVKVLDLPFGPCFKAKLCFPIKNAFLSFLDISFHT